MQTQAQYTTPALRIQVLIKSSRRALPIFDIKKVDRAWITFFYLHAWCFVLPPRDDRKTNRARNEIINSAAREFRQRCRLAGIKIGHGAYIKGVLSRMYFGHTGGILDLWLARELLDLYLDAPIEFHAALTPYVQMKIKKCNKNYSWQLSVKMTGEK